MPWAAGRSLRLRLTDLAGRAAGSPAIALVPLRLFLGGTFLYAGVDKLVRPGFFIAGAPGSIQQQLAQFARHSPLGELIGLIEPWAVAVGFTIALIEIAVGLGALSGFGFRLAALGGLALSVLFWLTASWATKPYYYGPDLPYAAGWLTLAIAGHGNVLLPPRFRTDGSPLSVNPGAIARRALLQAGALAAAAVAVATIVDPLRRLGFGSETNPGLADDGIAGETPGPTGPAATMPGGIAIATTADLQATGAKSFTVPFDAPAPLPAGDPAVIVELGDGTYAAFNAICTHAGCTVEWDEPDRLLVCPCHGAVFDPAKGGLVLAGPTDQPLVNLPLVLDQATGTFLLRAG